MSLSVLSLFAGIGGLDLGLERAGCKTRWYSEVDPYACKVMALRFPDAVNLGDITTMDWSMCERPDIICGGFPCQDISLAGKGAGIAEGTRSGLWSYYADAIRALRPRLVVVENVAALLTRGLGRVLGNLAACGYDAEWDCIPAASVGAPHRRDRLFVIAYPERIEQREFRFGSASGVGAGGEGDSSGVSQSQVSDHASCPSTMRGASIVGNESDGDVADADQFGTQVPHRRRHPAIEVARRDGREGRSWPTPSGADWWRVEPGMGGMVDGLSARLDESCERVASGIPQRVARLRCLGNAVVPQVAEHVARIALERIR